MNNEEKEKKDKKIKEEKEYKIESEEDLINMLNEIMNEVDSDSKVVIKTDRHKALTIKTFDNIFIDYLYNLIINMALIISFSGLSKAIYSDKLYILIIFAFVFGTLDYWVKTLIYKFKPVLFFKTLGYIFTLSSTIIMALLGTIGVLFCEINLNSAWIVILSYFLFLIIRALITTYIKRIK